MANPGGANQFGSYEIQAPYGDMKRQTQLTKESPISGSPLAAHALETPRRSQKQATRGQAAVPPVQPQAAAPGPSTGFQVGAAWQQIAAVPGASPLVQQMAQLANG